MLTVEEKRVRGAWALGILVFMWPLYAIALNSDVIDFGPSIEQIFGIAPLLALASMTIAIILSLYEAQWRRVSGKESSVQVIFRFAVAPVLVLVVPTHVLIKKGEVIFLNAPDGIMALAIIILLFVVYLLLVAGRPVFQLKSGELFEEETSYEQKKERDGLFWYHVVVIGGAAWAFFFLISR